ncbi:MAG: oxygen-dependent coproporphyrinogen oxidase [Bacteroidota bacterium]
MRDRVVAAFTGIQDAICKGLEELDGSARFVSDQWERPGGGGGDTRVIQNGAVFEKGGVNFSAVHGELPEAIAREFKSSSTQFFASGVSIVLHPQSPMVPIIHMNIRYFEMPGDGRAWFGGGIDLTPIYVDHAQATGFHQTLKATCDRHHTDYYAKFKNWADEYFYIKHRKETRGIGGIFFDRLSDGNSLPLEAQFEFVKDVGNTFLKAYLPIATANKDLPFTEAEKNWQLLRRGRYVEFNLVYDRGTHFGLQTDGRIESILMSLPTLASWQYNIIPEAGSREEETINYLKGKTEWV